jgi:MerR family transcriptional regulator, light-induced transcriptional regulator
MALVLQPTRLASIVVTARKILAILTTMRKLITAGVAPAEAAQQAKDFKGPISVEHIMDTFEVREDLVEALYAASKLLDKTFVEDALRKDIEKHGVIASWSEVIVPLLFLIGEDWKRHKPVLR